MKTNYRKYYINIGLLLITIFASGCYYDQVLPVEIEGDVSYSVTIQPIFDAKCVSCHNGGGIPLDLSSGTSYDNLFSGNHINISDPANSLLYTKINTGGSMEPYANDTDRATILKWIEQGANDN